ncbi:accessory gene regulator ArgB-like protein [Metaclostridioides mangenotii]|uniref:Accessory gene regulator B n=1 Tax=Metaclostridioides mangenotii TaxID=1540 RepID=A0ABS4E822_9FIRM|nr:accessory gene regulator B family protein [Clostridioides mangenotii]MBP1854063.1 accessory gene regulator B [Clostridioides mangenotii]
MIKSCADKVTSYLIERETIEDEEFEIYSYGFETLIAFVVNIAVILIIGYMLNKFNETLLFLCFYCPIRQFSGGFHAENYRRCLLVFITLYLSNTYILDKLMNLNTDIFITIISIISYVGIVFLSPQEHRNNPLSNKERKKYIKIVTYLSSFLLVISFFGIRYAVTYEYAMYAFSVIVCIFIMLILGILKKGVTNL